MNREQLEATFDQQAPTYDAQWARLAAFRDGLHLLLASVFGRLPDDARILCVGAGTGAEIHFLATRFPGWSFVAVEPSSGMVQAGRERAMRHGYADRCTFHEGYLDTLAAAAPFDAATSLLVSQFILDPHERARYFRTIADRLRAGGLLASSDLSAEVTSAEFPSLLDTWLRTMAAADVPPDRLRMMREAYDRDVAILAPPVVEAIIASAGFESPVAFYQAGLIRAWYARRGPD